MNLLANPKFILSGQFLCLYRRTRCPLQYSYLHLPPPIHASFSDKPLPTCPSKAGKSFFSTVKASSQICFFLLSFPLVHYFLNHYESTVAERWARDHPRHSVSEKKYSLASWGNQESTFFFAYKH